MIDVPHPSTIPSSSCISSSLVPFSPSFFWSPCTIQDDSWSALASDALDTTKEESVTIKAGW